MNTPSDQPSGTAGTPCKFLRAKEMFYEPPGDQADDAFVSDTFWCTTPQEGFGPDGEPAETAECQCGRSCYAGL